MFYCGIKLLHYDVCEIEKAKRQHRLNVEEVIERLEDTFEGQEYTGELDSEYGEGDEPIMPGSDDEFSDLETELLQEADGTLIAYSTLIHRSITFSNRHC